MRIKLFSLSIVNKFKLGKLYVIGFCGFGQQHEVFAFVFCQF